MKSYGSEPGFYKECYLAKVADGNHSLARMCYQRLPGRQWVAEG